MAINWSGVEGLLDQAATLARQEATIDSAMHVYNNKVIAALKLMISTAKVNGSGVVAGGTCTDGGPVAGANVTNATIA